MDKTHEDHLQSVKDEFTRRVDTKYRNGQKEHGGKLWENPALLEEAISEAIDQVTYLVTLKQQLERNDVPLL